MVALKNLFLSALATTAYAAPVAQTAGADAGASINGVLEDMVGDIADNVNKFLGLPIINAQATGIIPNKYMVMYNDTFDDDAIDVSVAQWTKQVQKRNLHKRGELGNLLSQAVHTITFPGAPSSSSGGVSTADVGGAPAASRGQRMMILEADDAMINEIFNSPEVAWIEADTQVNISATIAQTNAPLGLDRLSGAQQASKNFVFDESAGEGITVYVVDTGVKVDHVEFEGRATFGANFADNVDDDVNGHGTHVAGTVAGATFGVAKKADIVGVKVLGEGGGGATSGVLDGLTFAFDDAQQKNKIGKAVINMSLGGTQSNSLDRMVNQLVQNGMVVVVAAGNEFQDTAKTSPGGAEQVITVGAIDASNDQLASFSNFGPGVDILAPGVDVLSCGIESNTAEATLSGTSMASPHVAGLAAYLMGVTGETSPSEVQTMIENLAKNTGAEAKDPQGAQPGFLDDSGTKKFIANNGFRI